MKWIGELKLTKIFLKSVDGMFSYLLLVKSVTQMFDVSHLNEGQENQHSHEHPPAELQTAPISSNIR
jgi:hypothetical protein